MRKELWDVYGGHVCINGRGDKRSHVMGVGVGGCNLCCGFDKSGLVWSLSKLLTPCLV